ELLLADENSVLPLIILQQHLQRWSRENPAELMELSFGESGYSIAKMSYSIPRVFYSVLLLTQALFSDGGMCRQLGSAGRVTAACLIQAQASTQLLDHVPAGTLTQTPAMLNPPGALSVEDRCAVEIQASELRLKSLPEVLKHARRFPMEMTGPNDGKTITPHSPCSLTSAPRGAAFPHLLLLLAPRRSPTSQNHTTVPWC
ncbi:uncharacterized, partial [Tachysurus ichikawai]